MSSQLNAPKDGQYHKKVPANRFRPETNIQTLRDSRQNVRENVGHVQKEVNFESLSFAADAHFLGGTKNFKLKNLSCRTPFL